MEDSKTGHGFLPQYNGPNVEHMVTGLLRNTTYRSLFNPLLCFLQFHRYLRCCGTVGTYCTTAPQFKPIWEGKKLYYLPKKNMEQKP